MSTNPTVAAVVVTYNSAATIAACLQSLVAQGISEIIVVDNASTDTTRAVVANQPVIVLPQSRNVGFGAACNVGAAATQAPYLFFLNPDAVVQPKAVAGALEYLQAHSKVGVVGLKLIGLHGEAEPANYGRDVTLFSLFTRKFTRAITPTAPLACDWVSGGAMLVRQKAWQEAKGFDPDFFLYWEDVDLCRRLREHGWEVWLVPTATATHTGGSSFTHRAEQTRQYDTSADRYFRKHYATQTWLLQHWLRKVYRWLSPRAS